MYRRIIAFMSAIVIAIFASGVVLAESAQASTYRYVAHRGKVNTKYMGNSIQAFKQAAATPGIWGMETDIRMTKDGKLVCNHDSTWNKTSIAGTKLSSLRAHKYSSGGVTYSLTTFAEYLDVCKSGGKYAVIELKFYPTASQCKTITDAVAAKGMLKQCMFTGHRNYARQLKMLKDAAKKNHKVDVIARCGTGSTKSEVDAGVSLARKNGLNGVGCNIDSLSSYVKSKIKGTKLTLSRNGQGETEASARKLVQAGFWSVYVEFTPKLYTVTYKDSANGKTIKTQKVPYGSNASAPSAPKHTGKTFDGWSRNSTNITGNTTITAKYSTNKYKVVFKDGVTSKVLKEQTVEYSKAATAPAKPTRTGYTFAGWDKTFAKVSANMTVTAKWKANKYKVVFKDGVNSKALKEQTVEYSKAATAPATPRRTGYTFAGWNKAFAKVTGNMTVTAKWNINTYTVTFKDGVNGKVLSTQNVQYGKAAIAPSAPAHAGYNFSKWDKSFGKVDSNIVVTALYASEAPATVKYTVVFRDALDGKTLKEQVVEKGKSAVAPAAPVHAGYTFAGWDKAFSSISSNITVNATYRKSQSAVENSQLISIRNATVVDKTGNVIVSKSSMYEYAGGKPVCPVYEVHVGGQKLSKDKFLTYYFKNRKKGMATVVLRGIHSAGYKDAIILNFKIS